MLLPALACFSKLKRDKRHTYRHAPATIPNKYVHTIHLSTVSFFFFFSFFFTLLLLMLYSSLNPRRMRTRRETVLELIYSLSQPFSKRIPASWRRFLWFMTCLGLASFALLAGQGQFPFISPSRCSQQPHNQPCCLDGPHPHYQARHHTYL
jgi:hypothetical protein